jgi:hypothetical protein
MTSNREVRFIVASIEKFTDTLQEVNRTDGGRNHFQAVKSLSGWRDACCTSLTTS